MRDKIRKFLKKLDMVEKIYGSTATWEIKHSLIGSLGDSEILSELGIHFGPRFPYGATTQDIVEAIVDEFRRIKSDLGDLPEILGEGD